MRKLIYLPFICIYLHSETVFAETMEFYTYGGFDAMRDAFQRIALIFSDNQFITLIGVMAILGIFSGVIFLYIRGQIGGQVNLNTVFIPILIGAVVYLGLTVPKGTLIVTDPVKNRFQEVGDIPVGIVLVSGILNTVERIIVDVVDTASAYPYEKEAGGLAFDLIYRATSEHFDVQNFLLTKSIGRYFIDCSPLALSNPDSGLSEQSLKRDVTDWMAELEKMALYHDYTVYYDSDNARGVTTTCNSAWSSIKPILNNSSTFTELQNSLCSKVGFDSLNAGEREACSNLLARALHHFGVPDESATALKFVRTIYLVRAMDEAIHQMDPSLAMSQLAGRNMLVQGMGINALANEWLPQLRAVTYALALTVIPLVSIFLITPYVGKVLFLVSSLLMWLVIWGAADAAVYTMTVDSAHAYFDNVIRYNQGFDAIWNAQEASAKALALFGKIRSTGAVLATVISYALWKFGGYAFANLANNLTESIDREGVKAGENVGTPEGYMNMMSAYRGAATEAYNRSSLSPIQQGMLDSTAATTQRLGTQANLDNYYDMGFSRPRYMDQQAKVQSSQNMAALNAARHVTQSKGVDPNNTREMGRISDDIYQSIEQERLSFNSNMIDHYSSISPTGDWQDGLAKMAATRSVERHGDNVTTQTLLNDIKYQAKKEGVQLSDRQAAIGLAHYRSASTKGDIGASDGDPNQLADLFMNMRSFDLNKNSAIGKLGAELGLSFGDLGKAAGAFDGAQFVGQSKALDNLSSREIIGGYLYNNLVHGNRYIVGDDLANRFNFENLNQMVNEIENRNLNGQIGYLLRAEHVSNMLGIDNSEMYLRETGDSSISFKISDSDQLSNLAFSLRDDSNLLSREQIGEIYNGIQGGKSYDVSMGIDSVDGGIASLNFRTGSNVNETKTISRDDSVYRKTGAVQNDNVIRELLYDPEKLFHHLESFEDKDGAIDNFLNQAAHFYGNIGTRTASQSDNWSYGANGGFDLKIGKKGFPLSFHASENKQISKSDSESASSNVIRSGLQGIISNAYSQANMAASINIPNNQTVDTEDQFRIESEYSYGDTNDLRSNTEYRKAWVESFDKEFKEFDNSFRRRAINEKDDFNENLKKEEAQYSPF